MRVPRNLWLLGITSLLMDASSELVFPLLPLFLASLGGGALAVGAMEGLAESVASFLKLQSGRLSDRWQRRKGLTIAGYATSAVMKLGLPFAFLPIHVILLRAADRIGKGIRNSPRDALIADSVPAHRRGWAFGLHRALDTTGAFLGPLLGLALLPFLGLRQLFAIAVVPAGLAVVTLFAVREPRADTGASKQRIAWPTDARFLSFLLVIALFTLGNFGYLFLLLRAAEAGTGIQSLLLLQLAYTAVYAVLAWPLGSITDRVGRRPLLIVSMLALTLGSLLMTRVEAVSLWTLAPALVAFAVSSAAFEGNGRALAVDLAPPHARGTSLGAYHATIGLAALPAGLLGGYLWGANPDYTFFVGAVASLAATLALALLSRPRQGSRSNNKT